VTELPEADRGEEVPSCYVLMKITVDTFTGGVLNPKELRDLSTYFAEMLSTQMMTDRAIVTLEGTPVGEFVYVSPKEFDGYKNRPEA
jgi:hypothetical protein